MLINDKSFPEMKNSLKILLLLAAAAAAVSCSKSRLEQMRMADRVSVDCTPEVLALVGEKIPVDIAVSYPAGYFHPKALLEVTPVLVYAGGSQTGPKFTYQGEKVLDNFKVVPSDGGTVREHFDFTYEEGVEQARLELRSVAYYKDKQIAIPAIHVADGTILTQLLADPHGSYSFKKDNYQYVIHEQTEGQVMYDYNSSDIKRSELRSQSILELQAALEEIASDPRYSVSGTQIVAYASPEGGRDYNAKLSDQRAASAEKAWSQVTGGQSADNLEVRSIGQDWEGFRQAVERSDIEDKDLILRVLSMYSDPAVRESEIKNMSQIYTELNKSVFPVLRRARFIADVDYQNFTDEELFEMARQAVDVLDEEGLLRVAALSESPARKAELYNKVLEKYASERARFNLAVLALNELEPEAASRHLSALRTEDADVVNAKGVVELQRGNLDAASDLFRKAATPEARANLGLIDLMRGNYDAAARQLQGTEGLNGAVALILAGRLDEAAASIKDDSAQADYLRAIIAARRGDAAGVRSSLDAVSRKDAALYAQAQRDVEFAKFR